MRWTLVAVMVSLLPLSACRSAADLKYSVRQREDGGYILDIATSKRHGSPVTAEGMFPAETTRGKIEIIGSGEYWQKGNFVGYFYPINKIFSTSQNWDYGYAWVDRNHQKLYLNLYWAVPPQGMKKSQFSGVYVLKK